MTTNDKKPDDVVREEVQADTVYSEVYNEMRRYRDFEFQSSTWYLAILVAILGFLVSERFAHSEQMTGFGNAVAHSWPLKIALLVMTGVTGFVSWWLVRYASRRYKSLREFANSLEPSWTSSLRIEKVGFLPRHVFYITPMALVLAIWAVILWPSC